MAKPKKQKMICPHVLTKEGCPWKWWHFGKVCTHKKVHRERRLCRSDIKSCWEKCVPLPFDYLMREVIKEEEKKNG